MHTKALSVDLRHRVEEAVAAEGWCFFGYPLGRPCAHTGRPQSGQAGGNACSHRVDAQPDLDPERLVFIYECGISTKMARMYGRAPRREHCRTPVPHGH